MRAGDRRLPGRLTLLPPDGDASAAEPFAAGRDADVYALDDSWVVRRYRNGRPVGAEAEFMRWVAKHDYPVPAVRQVDGPDIVLQRLSGTTLADAAIAGEVSAVEVGLIHADLHRRLHEIPPMHGTTGLVVVHGDLHPYNVMLTPDGPIVIDWANAEEGPAEFDLAMTAVIFAQVALDPPELQLSAMLREALTSYLANSIDPTPHLPGVLTKKQQRHAHQGRAGPATAAGPTHPQPARRAAARSHLRSSLLASALASLSPSLPSLSPPSPTIRSAPIPL